LYALVAFIAHQWQQGKDDGTRVGECGPALAPVDGRREETAAFIAN
jgi:hypothetical protein